MIERKCSCCEMWLIESEDNFYFSNNSKPELGYASICKKCRVLKSKKWNQENKEIKNNNAKKYRQTEKVKQQDRKRKKKFRENGGYKEWCANNPDKMAAYRESHRDHEIDKEEWILCKEYFNNSCAYCDLHISEHFINYAGEMKWTDLHKEHKDHDGANDLSNCIPACQSCNTSKWAFPFDEWYNETNPHFTQERLNNILQWLHVDHKKYIKIPI